VLLIKLIAGCTINLHKNRGNADISECMKSGWNGTSSACILTTPQQASSSTTLVASTILASELLRFSDHNLCGVDYGVELKTIRESALPALYLHQYCDHYTSADVLPTKHRERNILFALKHLHYLAQH
jgi:hypothetical protein